MSLKSVFAVSAVFLLAGCAGEARLDVVPVRGKILLKTGSGEKIPMGGARLVLHPLEGKENFRALPVGRVAEDGSFKVGLYAQTDGAPEGEYVVTVRWLPQRKVKFKDFGQGNWDRGQDDRLRGKYSDPATSQLRVTVAEGKDLSIVVDAP